MMEEDTDTETPTETQPEIQTDTTLETPEPPTETTETPETPKTPRETYTQPETHSPYYLPPPPQPQHHHENIHHHQHDHLEPLEQHEKLDQQQEHHGHASHDHEQERHEQQDHLQHSEQDERAEHVDLTEHHQLNQNQHHAHIEHHPRFADGPTFSLANSMDAYEREAELEQRIHDEHVKTVEELPLEMEVEREAYYEHSSSSSEDEHHKSPFKSRATSKATSRMTSRAASRAVSRAPSKPPSRAPSRPMSRQPSVAVLDGGLIYGIVDTEDFGIEEPHDDDEDEYQDRDGDGEDEGDEGDGRDHHHHHGHGKDHHHDKEDGESVVLEKVKSHASTIVDIFVNPVERESWRKIVHKNLENPLHSRVATGIAIFMNAIVLMSIIIVVAFPPNFSPDAPRSTLDKIEIFVSVVFTVEYLLRFITCAHWFRWFIKPQNIIDLTSLLPFYIQLITNESVTGLQILRFVRLLRILRLVRILKLAKHYRQLYGPKFRTKKRYLKLKYVLANILHQVHAVVPLSIYVFLFQYVMMGVLMHHLGEIIGGLLLVIGGLFLFIEGIKHGLMPLGTKIGTGIPIALPPWALYIVTFITGIIVTFAEPAVVALTVVGKYIPVEKAPHLAYIMESWSIILLVFVGIGVGFASVLGVMKYSYNWSMKTLIYCSVIPNLALTCVVAFGVDKLKGVADLSWDCAAVTTGPVTVPIVLALGVGVANLHSLDPSKPSQGFGIVTLASLYPVMAVQILGFISLSISEEDIIKKLSGEGHEDITEETPYHELINGIRAIVPLIVFLFILLKLVLKANLLDVLSYAGREKAMSGAVELAEMDFGSDVRKAPDTVVPQKAAWKIYGMWGAGLLAATVGVIFFNFGITFGLAEMGEQAGAVLPGSFLHLESMPDSPSYAYGVGLFVMLFFSWVLGYLVTQAEPALHVMGDQVQEIGLMRKRTLVFAVSSGVGTGIAIGVLLVIYKVTLTYVILGGYMLALIMTHYSEDFLVNVAWDSAAVTTGDVTVPFVLVLGVSLADAVGGIGGFGILTMASLVPIQAVLLVGFITRFLEWRKTRADNLERLGSAIPEATQQ